MGKVSGGGGRRAGVPVAGGGGGAAPGGRTGFQTVDAQGNPVRNLGFAPNLTQAERRRATAGRALQEGAAGFRATNDTARQGGAPNQFGRVTRAQVRVTGAGNVRPNTVGVHTFLIDGRQRAYSRATYRVARGRAVADAARAGQPRISYVGNNG